MSQDREQHPAHELSMFLKNSELMNAPRSSVGSIEFYPELYFRPGVLRNLWENDEAANMNESDLRRQVTYMIRHPEEYEQEEILFLVTASISTLAKTSPGNRSKGSKKLRVFFESSTILLPVLQTKKPS
jgi:hypothetical protein